MKTYRLTCEDLKTVFRLWQVTSTDVEMWSKVADRLRRKRIPITMCKLLGSGSKGRAFQINETTVMKITEDEKEVHASLVVKQHPSVYFPRIRDAFSVKGAEGEEPRYFIIQEKLERCDTKWGEFVQGMSGNTIKPIIVKRLREHRSDNNGNLSPENERKFKWLNGVAMYFKKHRITYYDLHEGNLMQKAGKHKVIDLGYTKVKKQKFDSL